ncbi:MAG: PH domain-containing protein [Verrucomicrobiales bacterium]|nr:PH domain-containing protein [Verrucomicrobiales bacterium]
MIPEALRSQLLWFLRLPPEPHPPAGAPGSLRRFRAAPNYFRLRMVGWALKQASALVGILVAIAFFHGAFGQEFLHKLPQVRTWMAVGVFVEGVGLILFLLQLPVTLLATRLDYELRWYFVTDRSLRIRAGVWTSEELTMTFANIQEITLHQGPLQRWLGIADLKVRSAGGGAKISDDGSTEESHVAYFRGVDNATEIRDLILQHLRSYRRDSGLGDPDSPAAGGAEPGERAGGVGGAASSGALIAARELLGEVQQLRPIILRRGDRNGNAGTSS